MNTASHARSRPPVATRLLEQLWIQALKPNGVLPTITIERVRAVRALILTWEEEDNA